MKLVAGVDPGYTCTGLVLGEYGVTRGEVYTVTDWTTFTAPREGGQDLDFLRAASLALRVVDTLFGWLPDNEIFKLDLCIETPIYRRNPQVHAIQWRLIQEIEAQFAARAVSSKINCFLTHVNPSTVKALAGVSGKTKPVDESPFADYDLPRAQKEALADAWAIGLATRWANQEDDDEWL